MVETTSEKVVELDDEALEQIRDALDENENTADLSGLLSEIGDSKEAKINIYREATNGRKNAFLFSCTADDYDFAEIQERLRDDYDGGNFVVHVRANNRWKAKRSFAVEPPKKSEKPEPTNNSGDMANIMLTMRESQQASIDQMREMMAQQAANQQSVLIEMIRAQSASGQPAQAPMTPMDLISMMVSMKELNPPPPVQSDDSMTTFLKGLEFGKDLGGDGESSALQTAIKTFGGPLVEMSKHLNPLDGMNIPAQQQAAPQQMVPQQMAPQQAAPQQVAPLASPDNLPPLPVENEKPEGEDMNLLKLQRLKPVIEMMAHGASLKADPEIYANLLLDQAGLDIIDEYIAPQERYEQLFTFAPGLQPFRPWFDEVRGIALSYIAEDDEIEIDVPEPPPENVSDSNATDIPHEASDVHAAPKSE